MGRHPWAVILCKFKFPGFEPRSGVQAVARRGDHLDVFAPGADGRVWSTWWNEARSPQQWFGWFAIPEDQRDLPPTASVTAIARRPDRLDVFAIAQDGKVSSTTWPGTSTRWAEWFTIREDQPSFAPGAPVAAVARRPEHLDLFAVGSDGRIWSTWWDDMTSREWNPWFPIGDEQPSFSTGTAVIAVARRPEQIDVFAVAGDGLVWSANWNSPAAPSRWSPWFPIRTDQPPVMPGVPVAAVARRPEHLDLFVVARDGRVWSTWWNDTISKEWNPWFPIGEKQPTIRQDAAPTALARRAEQIDLFAVADDGRVWSTTWNPPDRPSQWASWFQIGSDQPEFAPGTAVAAVARRPEHLDLFVTGQDGQVWSTWWNDTTSKEWNPWFSLPPPPETLSPDYCNTYFTTYVEGGLPQYWRNVSHGTIRLDGSRMLGVFQLSYTRMQAIRSANERRERSDPTNRTHWRAFYVQDAVDDVYRRTNLEPFTGVIVVFDAPIDAGATSTWLKWEGGSREVGAMILDHLSFAPAHFGHLTEHESGHMLGLPHAWLLDPSHQAWGGETAREYGDGWDIMGGMRLDTSRADCRFIHPNPALGDIRCGPGLSAHNLRRLECLHPSRVMKRERGTTFEVTLAAVNRGDASGPLMLELPLENGKLTTLTVELRWKDWWDRGIPRHAFLLHVVDRNGVPYLVSRSVEQHDWVPGQSYRSDDDDLEIRFVRIDDSASGSVAVSPRLHFTLFYDSRSGELATGRIMKDGSHSTLRSYERGVHPVLMTDIATTQDAWLFYDQSSGAGSTATIDPDGSFRIQRTWEAGSFARGWSHIVGAGDRLLFFNSSTGAGATAEVHPDGDLRTLRDWGSAPFPGGWTHIVGVRNRFLFYDSSTGAAVTGKINPDGSYETLERWPADAFAQGWSHLAAAGDRLLLYNATTGAGETGTVDVRGMYRTLHSYRDGSFARAWSHVAGAGDRLLFYSASSGKAATGRIDPEGNFHTLHDYPDGSARRGWTHINAAEGT